MVATHRIVNHLRWYSSVASSLETPTKIFSNHHLLVINKPAGWRSIPSHNGPLFATGSCSKKCLLSHLKRKGLGGGSNNDFLLPVHRLDQPCTGVLALAKNSKAASRVQKAWARGQVLKEYLCVIESPVNGLRNRSIALSELEGLLSRCGEDVAKQKCVLNKSFDQTWGKLSWEDEKENVFVISGRIRRSSGGGRGSVQAMPVDMRSELLIGPTGTTVRGTDSRICHLQCRHVGSFPDLRSNRRGTVAGKVHLIAVRTSTGARHQVRALLSAVGGSPIVGDLRYGANGPAMPDQSVALHARSLFIPSVRLGGTDLSSAPFDAPIPPCWEDYFGLREKDLQQ
jgi:23S rRNA-/tRNA-specific pseudouridylate synthase